MQEPETYELLPDKDGRLFLILPEEGILSLVSVLEAIENPSRLASDLLDELRFLLRNGSRVRRVVVTEPVASAPVPRDNPKDEVGSFAADPAAAASHG